MTAISNSCHITLTSNPHKKRVGLVPICGFMALGLAFVVLCLVGGIINISQSELEPVEMANSALTIAAALAFCIFLCLASYGLMRDSYRDYILELTDTEAILIVIDRWRKKRGVQMVLLDDIVYAEYYPYRDSASIIFHTSYTDMEVPLWPMTNQGRDVVDYLEGRGVKVVNVQSDDPIPD